MVIICDGGGRDGGGGRISATGRRKRGRGEGREEARAREKRRRTRERTVIATTSPRESPTIRARVPVVTKSVDPDTVYRPRLSRSLACRRLYLPTRLHLPIYVPTNSWGGCCAPLSRGRERARARSTDACRRGLPILRAGRARPRASPTWIEGSVDPEVVSRANQLDRCQPWRADRAGGCQSERLHVLSSCRGSRSRSDCRGCPEVARRAFSKPKGVAGSQMRRGGAGRGDSTTRQSSTTWPQVPVAIGSARPGWLTFQVISR